MILIDPILGSLRLPAPGKTLKTHTHTTIPVAQWISGHAPNEGNIHNHPKTALSTESSESWLRCKHPRPVEVPKRTRSGDQPRTFPRTTDLTAVFNTSSSFCYANTSLKTSLIVQNTSASLCIALNVSPVFVGGNWIPYPLPYRYSFSLSLAIARLSERLGPRHVSGFLDVQSLAVQADVQVVRRGFEGLNDGRCDASSNELT